MLLNAFARTRCFISRIVRYETCGPMQRLCEAAALPSTARMYLLGSGSAIERMGFTWSGSHRRSRTHLEREVLIDRRHDDLPEQLAIELKRGQTIFWNGNIIHRGRSPKHLDERLSLVAHLSRHRDDELPGEVDDRERWLLAHDVRGALPDPLRPLYDRWRSLQRDADAEAPVSAES